MAQGVKKQRKLYRRRSDYDRMMASGGPASKASFGAFHKPGSFKK